MADEAKLRKQQERGERAKRLLENELLVESFEEIKKQLSQAWENSKADDIQRREDAWRSLKLLTRLEGNIRHIALTGEGARKDLLRVHPTITERFK